MKSKTRLDSAVFQLTPTRTRYNLVINANGKTEKISSGLLDPFLAHLKAAQDQVARGCYAILLEPSPVADAVWFTKGTVERFVRFVNTPEVLERVNMTKSEILQIDEAITVQNSDALVSNNVEGLKKKVEDNKERFLKSLEGSLPIVNLVAENTILLYALGGGADYMNSNGPAGQESSKVQFLRVLETRRTMLQKEQVMAFERAIAAGFDMDRMAHLISFAECFGAQRLMDACLGFMVLWKEKHETVQWFENEATEAVPRFVFSSTNNYNSMVQETKKHDEFKEARSDFNGKCEIADVASDHNKDHMSSDHQEFFQPVQVVSYHHNHMGGGPFFQPPYPRMEDPQFCKTESMAIKRHLMDGKDKNTELETWESQHDGSELVQEKRGKAGRIGRKKSGVVVIRNINYINSERRRSRPGGGSQSTSDPESEKEAEDLQDVGPNYKKLSFGSTKRKGSHTRPIATGNSFDREPTVNGHEADSGNWKIFQNILLRQNKKDIHATEHMLALENKVQIKIQNKRGADPIVPRRRDENEVRDGRRNAYHTNGAGKTHLLSASSDEVVGSRRELGRDSHDCLVDVHFHELESGRGGNNKAIEDGFVNYAQRTRSDYHISNSDALAGCGSTAANKTPCKKSLCNGTDESFILPLRSSSQDQVKADYRAVSMNEELRSGPRKKENMPSRIRSQPRREPDDLRLMPKRGTVREPIHYDPAVDYKVQVCARTDVSAQKRIKGDSVAGVQEISKKSDKDIKSRVLRDNAVKRKNGIASKLTPSTEAQARAEKIRSFKADLQKLKKTKEEEERKRLEYLKRERQKRITARSSSGPAQSTTLSCQMRPKFPPTSTNKEINCNDSESWQLPNRTASLGSSVSQKITRNNNLNKVSPSQSTLPSQMRPQPQTKLSPTSYKGSKFSDAEPGPSSPLQRLRKRAASLGSNASLKITRPSGDQFASHKPVRSVSSLPALREGVTPEQKVSAARIRMLSDRKISITKSGITDSPEPKVGVGGVRKPPSQPETRITDGSGVHKISTIGSEGRGKVEVPPDEKSRTLKRPSEVTSNINGTSSFTSEATQVQQSNTRTRHDRNGEEKQVIETTVVLENEMPVIPGERLDISEHKVGEKTGLVIEDAAVKEIEELYPRKVPEHTPCVQALHLEDTYTSAETAKAHTWDYTESSSVEKTPGSVVEPRVKVLSNGFRRILRFGRSTGKHNVESDRLMNKGSVVKNCGASTASSGQGKKLEQSGFKRRTMSHALYIA